MSETEKPKDQKQKLRGPSRILDAMPDFEKTEKLRKQLTIDGFDNFISKLGLNNDNTLSASTYTFDLVTRNRILLEASYRGCWFVGRVVDSVAEDMTRAGVHITTIKGEKNLKKLSSTSSRLKIGQSLNTLIKWGRLYGGAIAVVQTKGQKLSTPLNIETIGKDQFQGLAIYDRWQLRPVVEQPIDSGPDIGLPKYYDIVTNITSMSAGGQPEGVSTAPNEMTGTLRVHYSRVVRNIGIELPYFQAITEMMWGESVLERLWDRLIAFDNATMSAAQLIDRANLRHVGVENLREIIAAGGEAQAGLVAMFEMVRSMQTNEGFTLFDKNDEFQTTQYTFAGLADMLLQLSQQVSGSSEIPMVRLFSQSPSGLNATGDSDIRMYYDTINAKQNANLRNGWELILKVLWRSEFGENAPEDLEFTFVPLWQMSAKDKADIAKSNTEAIIGAFEADLISKPSAMKELRQNSSETGLFSNISDKEITDAENEPEDDPPLPGEADPEIKPDEKKVKDNKWNPKNWFKKGMK